MVGPRLGFSYDAWSSGLHGVLMFFATCSLDRDDRAAELLRHTRPPPETSGEPVIRNARTNARRRIAASRHCRSGCNHAPRPPGRLPAESTVTAQLPVPSRTAASRSRSTANSRFRQPTHVRTGPSGLRCARGWEVGVSRWITAQSTVTVRPDRIACRGGGSPQAVPGSAASLRMSIRQPVSRAASRAFCPPCRSPATAGSPVPPPGRRGWPRR